MEKVRRSRCLHCLKVYTGPGHEDGPEATGPYDAYCSPGCVGAAWSDFHHNH